MAQSYRNGVIYRNVCTRCGAPIPSIVEEDTGLCPACQYREQHSVRASSQPKEQQNLWSWT